MESAPSSPRPHRDLYELVLPRRSLGAADAVPLPSLCVKCGAPSTTVLPRRFVWHEFWIYLLLPTVVLFLFVRLILSKRLHVNVPLCATHYARLNRIALVGWSLVVVGLLLFCIAVTTGRSLWSFYLALGGGVIVSYGARPMRPVRIDDEGGTFKGCGEAFLDQLEAPDSAPTPAVQTPPTAP